MAYLHSYAPLGYNGHSSLPGHLGKVADDFSIALMEKEVAATGEEFAYALEFGHCCQCNGADTGTDCFECKPPERRRRKQTYYADPDGISNVEAW